MLVSLVGRSHELRIVPGGVEAMLGAMRACFTAVIAAVAGAVTTEKVVEFRREFQSTILRNLGVADIAFRGLNDVRCFVE